MTGAQLSVVIGTVYRPPTLEPLIAQATEQGAEVIVLAGMTTNAAWNAGLRAARTHYVAVLNDDIALVPAEGWVEAIVAAHKQGATMVLPQMADRPQRGRSNAEVGHCFSMDVVAVTPTPVPDGLIQYYGDNWFFEMHRRHGLVAVTDAVTCRLGKDAGLPGRGGWTGLQPDVNKHLMRSVGMDYAQIWTHDTEVWEKLNP
jgi:hypothetical protein